MAKSLLQDDSQMADLAYPDEDDGNFESLTPDEPASPQEEAAMAIGTHKLMDDLYSDEGLPKFANVFHQDQRELFEVIPELAYPMLLAAKQEIEEQMDEAAPSSVFFAQGGLLEQNVDRLFELAQQLNIPGSQDPDQYAAAMMATYKKAAEYIMETNDEQSMREAAELGGEMVAEKEAGTLDLDEAQKVLQKRMKRKGVPDALSGVLGGGM